MQSTSSERAETINRQFPFVFTQEETNNLPHLPESTTETLPDTQVTEGGVRKLPEDLNPNKASGPDDVSSSFLKEMASSVSAPLTQIFQASLDQEQVPDVWKGALILYHPYSRNGTESNHPIVDQSPLGTSICCKVLEHIVHIQIISHLEQQNVLSENQHGFL